MNVTTKLKHIDSDIIENYLTALDIEDVNEYLFPSGKYWEDYYNYPNMKEAVMLFRENLAHGVPIHIVIDSDCDGACSAAIMYNFLINSTA